MNNKHEGANPDKIIWPWEHHQEYRDKVMNNILSKILKQTSQDNYDLTVEFCTH